MSQFSFRRRLAGRALLAAGVLALPLTASITYAASEAAQIAPEPPAPPAPPSAPDAPTPPEAPEAPKVMMIIDTETGTVVDGEGDANVVVTERVERGEDGKERKVRIVRRLAPGQTELSEAEQAEMEKELREGLAEADKALADMPRILEEALAEAEVARGEAAKAGAKARVVVRRHCRPGSTESAETTQNADGTSTVLVCERHAYASARSGLQEARDEIAANRDIPEETRKRILKELDSAIARWKEKEG